RDARAGGDVAGRAQAADQEQVHHARGARGGGVMATIQELPDLGDEELVERLESDKEELFNLRFQLATGQLDNPMRIKDVRHDIAPPPPIVSERASEQDEALGAEVEAS